MEKKKGKLKNRPRWRCRGFDRSGSRGNERTREKEGIGRVPAAAKGQKGDNKDGGT